MIWNLYQNMAVVHTSGWQVMNDEWQMYIILEQLQEPKQLWFEA